MVEVKKLPEIPKGMRKGEIFKDGGVSYRAVEIRTGMIIALEIKPLTETKLVYGYLENTSQRTNLIY